MNTTRHLIAAVALSFAAIGGASAQEATLFPATDLSASTVTRAAVTAEAVRALAAGELSEYAQINPTLKLDGSLSRETVRMATVKALRNGSLDVHALEAYTIS